MPITTAFTITSGIAFLLLSWLLYLVYKRADDYLKGKKNGLGKQAAFFLIRLVSIRLLNSAILLVAGLGILTGIRPLGYLLALLPITYVVATVFDIRFLRHE